ncbi:MAG: hypothetical protein AAFN91_01755 [Pseudomonadota bacterium]
MNQMTKLERAVIDKLADVRNPYIPNLRQHIPHIQVLDRAMTGAGFYTDMMSSLGPMSAQEGKVEGVSAKSPNDTSLMSFILWVDQDGTCALEGFTYADDWPADSEDYTVFLEQRPQ